MATNANPTSRRALLAAAAGSTVALVAESLTRPQPVRAHDPDDVLLGGMNDSTATTTLRNTSGPEGVLRLEGSTGSALDASTDDANAIQAVSDTKAAISAQSKQFIAIVGHAGEHDGSGGSNGGPDTTGVIGFSGAGAGVRGICKSGIGTQGQSASGVGVHAQSTVGKGLIAESGTIGIESHTYGTTSEEAMNEGDFVGVWGMVDGDQGGFGIAVRADGRAGVGVMAGGGLTGVHGYSDVVGVEGKSLPGVGVVGSTLDGYAVSADVYEGGSGIALIAHGPVIFDSAGRVTIPAGTKSFSVTSPVPLAVGSSKILVTLLGNPSGTGKKAVPVYLSHVQINATTFDIVLTGTAGQSVDAAFFIIN